MRCLIRLSLVVAWLLVAAPQSVSAEAVKVEGELLKSLSLEEPPVDVAVAADGKRLFILTGKGDVLVYSRDGEMEGRVAVGKGMEGLEILPPGDQILLHGGKSKELKIVELAFIQKVNVQGAPILGAEDAPVTIVVFDDFQCPYCAALAPQLKELVGLYPGKVRLVFKQFPLNIHPFARKAAIASLAAFRQGKFWEYHDLLFDNAKQLNDQKLRALAGQAGLDPVRFEADLQDRGVWADLNRDLQDGVAAGVRGTPAVFVNGRVLKDRSMEAFRRVIEAELRKVKGT